MYFSIMCQCFSATLLCSFDLRINSPDSELVLDDGLQTRSEGELCMVELNQEDKGRPPLKRELAAKRGFAGWLEL